MSSKNSEGFPRTAGIRILFRRFAILISGCLVLWILTHALISYVLKQKDRERIQLKLDSVASQYEKEGFEGIKNEIAFQETLDPESIFLIRIVGPQNTVLVSTDAAFFKDFDLNKLDTTPGSLSGWICIDETDEEDEFEIFEESEVLEVAFKRLHDGNLLQVGKSSEDREDVFETYRTIFVISMVLLITFVAAFMLAARKPGTFERDA